MWRMSDTDRVARDGWPIEKVTFISEGLKLCDYVGGEHFRQGE